MAIQRTRKNVLKVEFLLVERKKLRGKCKRSLHFCFHVVFSSLLRLNYCYLFVVFLILCVDMITSVKLWLFVEGF